MTSNHIDHREVRVTFDLEVEDGFPPISSESLVGKLVDIDKVLIDNTPFFISGVCLGDTVKVHGNRSDYIFDCVDDYGGNSALSVLLINPQSAEGIYQLLKRLGCYCEFGEFPEFDMLAVSVPSEVNYASVADALWKAEQAGDISFAELAIQHPLTDQ